MSRNSFPQATGPSHHIPAPAAMPPSSSGHGLEPCSENRHGSLFPGPVLKFAAFPRPSNQCAVCEHVSILPHSPGQYAQSQAMGTQANWTEALLSGALSLVAVTHKSQRYSAT